MANDLIPLFSRQRPYYIVADDFIRTESRARVMHHLCHALNLIGAEAYVLTGHVSPHLRTPALSTTVEKQHQDAGLQPIVVYPEQIRGNPLDAGTVVRYGYRARPATVEGEDCCFFADPCLYSGDRKSTRLNSSHIQKSRMPSSA